MRHVATPRCLCRCVCSRCTLAADAAEASKHQGGGRTAARAFARSARAARRLRSCTSRSSVVSRRFACRTPLSSACRAGSHPALRAASNATVARFRVRHFAAGRRVAREVASCASLRQRRTSRPHGGLRFQLHRARGRASARDPGLDEPGSSGTRAAIRSGRMCRSRQDRHLPVLPAVILRRPISDPSAASRGTARRGAARARSSATRARESLPRARLGRHAHTARDSRGRRQRAGEQASSLRCTDTKRGRVARAWAKMEPSPV